MKNLMNHHVVGTEGHMYVYPLWKVYRLEYRQDKVDPQFLRPYQNILQWHHLLFLQ